MKGEMISMGIPGLVSGPRKVSGFLEFDLIYLLFAQKMVWFPGAPATSDQGFLAIFLFMILQGRIQYAAVSFVRNHFPRPCEARFRSFNQANRADEASSLRSSSKCLTCWRLLFLAKTPCDKTAMLRLVSTTALRFWLSQGKPHLIISHISI